MQDKTKYIIFSYRKNIAVPQIKLGPDNNISQTDNTKFLGMHIDQNLRFNHHIDHISAKLSKSVGILRKVKEFLPYNVMLSLYYTFIHSYIVYVIICWYAAPKYLVDKIVKLQKKSIRHVFNLPCNSHTDNLFQISKVLTVDAIYNVNVLLYMFKTINANYDDSLLEMLRTNYDIHSINTRSRNNFHLPRYLKCASQKSVLYKAIQLWNELPDQTKEVNSLFAFKRIISNLYAGRQNVIT